MSIFLKWRLEDEEPQSSKAFATSAAAETCACYMLQTFRRKPVDVWIEQDGLGCVMKMSAITARCHSMESHPLTGLRWAAHG
jgi:hypothetical protein